MNPCEARGATAIDLSVLAKGVIIGLSIAAPVGPIGVLCIRRTISEGRLSGLATGLGAATADALYGIIAGFGLTFVTSFLVGYQMWFRLVGGLFLCLLGYRTFVSVPAERPAQSGSRGLTANYLSTVFLTLTNPTTILSFIAVFAGMGLGSTPTYDTASLLVLGVFLGSSLWWLILSGVVGVARGRFTSSGLLWVNRFSGLVILTFGGLALVSFLRQVNW